MPQAITFEQQLMSDVVKQVLTPAKIGEMAKKLGPQIEKEFEKKMLTAVKDFFDDYYINEIINEDDDIQNALNDKVRAAFGVGPKTAAQKARRR